MGHRFCNRVVAGLAVIAICAAVASQASAIFQAKTTPRLQLFQGDGLNFMLVDPLPYEIIRTKETIEVPAGFVTDFASVPWYARAFINVLGRHSIPAIVHDYLYWEQRCTREQADELLREGMIEYKSSWLDEVAVFYAVKYGANGAWKQNAADKKSGLMKVLPEDHRRIPLNHEWSKYRQDLFAQGVREEKIETGPPTYCNLHPR
jgi:hypothetical protein